jgi:serine/threonine protein phosphatase PrpC
MNFWKNWFPRKVSTSTPAKSYTVDPAISTTGEHSALVRGESASAPLACEIYLQSDPGCVRSNNEDRGIYTIPSDSELQTSKGSLVVVADGMGGASAGEVASEMAVRLIPDAYYASPNPPALALKEAVEYASKEIHTASQRDPELRGMGTTCVALAIRGTESFMAYVGDSRLYLLRAGELYQLTEDHSVVFGMVRQGIITREQARNHDERNVLSLSMGGRPEVSASFWESAMAVRNGDKYLLCSDGLHDLVSDDRIKDFVSGFSAEAAVQNLIMAAKELGGHDNITVAIVHVRSNEVQLLSVAEDKQTREFAIVRE